MSKKSSVLYAFANKDYTEMVSGKGMYLFDVNGKKYIDACSGQILVSLGYGLTEMGDVLKEQAGKISYLSRMQGTSSILEEAAKAIVDLTSGELDKAYFSSGGSLAVENAIKLANFYYRCQGKPSKNKIISRWLSFHGNTIGAESVGGFVRRREWVQPYLHNFPKIPPAYCYRCWFNKKPENCNLECAEALKKEILLQGPENIAAFIAEPIVGAALAAAVPRLDYFQRIREICDEFDILLIYDEVMTGVGRTGKWFGYEHFKVSPDILVLAKALTGGYFPSSAILVKQFVQDKISEKWGFIPLGYSWTGNPMCASVVLKTINYMKEHNLVENVSNMGAYLIRKLEELKEIHPTIGDVRGMGLMVGLEFVRDKTTKSALDVPFYGTSLDQRKPNFNETLHEIAFERSLILKTMTGNLASSENGNMAMIGPYYAVSKQEIDEIVSILDLSLTETEKIYGFKK
jgi:adenosylmethionine-8-amino-7-oxononanoate aminotransferase